MKLIMENWRKYLREGIEDSFGGIFAKAAQDALSGQDSGEDAGIGPSGAAQEYSSDGEAQHPLKGAGRFSSPMGDRASRRFAHNGQDISAPVGTKVYPLAEGTVVSVRSVAEFTTKSQIAIDKATASGRQVPYFINKDVRLTDYRDDRIQGSQTGCPLKSYRWVQKAFEGGGFKKWKEGGIWVMIEHPPLLEEGEVITAWYAHLHDLNVEVGDKVTKDTVIGTVGRSGVACNQPHLHLEMFTGTNTAGISGKASGSLIDPRKFIGKRM